MNRSDNQALHEALSAVMDGHATPTEWARVEAAWAGDPALRERWALWQAAGDGLRSAELPALHRQPQALLDALHAQMPAPVTAHPRRREWFAPFAVAAGFIAVAFGLDALRTPPSADTLAAAAPFATSRAEGLAGMSFAQTAAGPTLPSLGGMRETGVLVQTPPEIIDWGLALPEQAASRPAP